MPDAYQIKDQQGLYFLTFQVIDWVDIFTRNIYQEIIMDSLKFCIKHRGLLVWSYVIMSNHIHVIFSSKVGQLSNTIRDFKKFTSHSILKTIQTPKESRRYWMLKQFAVAAKRHKRNQNFQLWTHDNHAIALLSDKFIIQKCRYIHLNPVRAGWVDNASDWRYSSASNYEGKTGLLQVQLLDAMYKL